METLSETFKLHDKYQLEMKFTYPLDRKRGVNAYHVDTYLFFPGSLGLSPASYTKADFHGSPLWRLKAKLLPALCMRTADKLDFLSYCTDNYPSAKLSAYRGVKLAWTVRSAEEMARVKQYADNVIFENFRP